MHPSLARARSAALHTAVCAALLALGPAVRAEEVPEPVSRTVLTPPAQPAAEPAPPHAAAPPAPAVAPAPVPVPRSELGFSLRLGMAERDRFLVGGSVGTSSGPFMVGFSTDGTFDTRGSWQRRDTYDRGDGWDDWCHVGSDGRCTSRADVAMAGYVGLRHRVGPAMGGARLRLELMGELGWQWSFVRERVGASGSVQTWSEAARAFPIAGLRGQVGLTVFRNATFGVGGYARQGLAGRVCVQTDGGCNRVGGLTAGLYFFGGGDWGFGG